MYINTQANITITDHFKYQGTYQTHTQNKTVLHADLTKSK